MDTTKKIENMNNELLELIEEVSEAKDKDKKIELYEIILAKTIEFMAFEKKLTDDGADKLKQLNEVLHEIADLSIRNPKECRRRLKKISKI